MDKTQEIAVGAFIIKNGKVLITKRADTKSFYPGKYELPGGHLEFGETMQECIIREIQEELHVNVSVGMPFYAFTELHKSKTMHYIEVDYFARLKDSASKIRLNKEDNSGYEWINDSEVYKYFDKGDHEAEAVEEGFRVLEKLKNKNI